MRETKSQRLDRIMILSPKQKDLLIAGLLGVVDHLEQFPSSKVEAQEMLSEVDSLLDKFKEMKS